MSKISDYSITEILAAAGTETKRTGNQVVCRCPVCKSDNNLTDHNCQVNIDKNNIFCYSERRAYSRTELIRELDLYYKLNIERYDDTITAKPKTIPAKASQVDTIDTIDTKIIKEITYQFKDIDNNLLYKKRRRDFSDKSKDIKYLDKNEKQGVVFYGLENLRKPELNHIIFTEGEKCAEAVKKEIADSNAAYDTAVLSFNSPATEWKNIGKEAQDIILSKNIIIFSDNDAPGKRKTDELCNILKKPLKVIDFYDKDAGYDISDWLSDGGTITTALKTYLKDYTPETEPEYSNIDNTDIDIKAALKTTIPMPVVFKCFRTGTVGILAGSGGAGKSYISLALALSVADTTKKINYLDLFDSSTERGKAGFITLEDDRILTSNRLHSIFKFFNIKETDEVLNNIAVKSLYGTNFSLTKKTKKYEDPIINTENVDYLYKFCQDKKIVVIDTLRRLSDGLDENSSDDMSFLLKILEKISNSTGTSILLNAHTAKMSYENGQHNVRGSAAIVDNSRFTMLLARKNKEVQDENSNDKNKTKTIKQLYLSFEKVNAFRTPEPIALAWKEFTTDDMENYSMITADDGNKEPNITKSNNTEAKDDDEKYEF